EAPAPRAPWRGAWERGTSSRRRTGRRAGRRRSSRSPRSAARSTATASCRPGSRPRSPAPRQKRAETPEPLLDALDGGRVGEAEIALGVAPEGDARRHRDVAALEDLVGEAHRV